MRPRDTVHFDPCLLLQCKVQSPIFLREVVGKGERFCAIIGEAPMKPSVEPHKDRLLLVNQNSNLELSSDEDLENCHISAN